MYQWMNELNEINCSFANGFCVFIHKWWFRFVWINNIQNESLNSALEKLIVWFRIMVLRCCCCVTEIRYYWWCCRLLAIRIDLKMYVKKHLLLVILRSQICLILHSSECEEMGAWRIYRHCWCYSLVQRNFGI